MDGNRFDDLTRVLAAGASRRRIIKGLLGGLAGLASAAGLRSEGVEAQRLPNGSACTRATNCTSLKCVDGVCCDTACTGQCETCATGTCLPAPAGTQKSGTRPACTGTGVCQGSCDGVTRNQCTLYPGLDIVCNAPDCEGGWLTTYGCGGDGTCHPFTESCAPSSCNAEGTGCGEDPCGADRPLGEECTDDCQCASGICAQGVCCVEACAGGCFACNVPGNEGFCTEIADGGACDGGTCCDGECVDTQSNLEHCGTCDNACRLVPREGSCENQPICQAGTCTFTPDPQGTVCRASAGVCDPAEVCNGTALDCPPNAFHPSSVQCRASTGGCDPAEFCTGTGPLCPPDVLAAPGTVCRAAAGPCDVAEVCSGTSPTCPVDGFASAETVCRAAAGPCDVAEFCTGTGPNCPPDGFVSAGTVCRAAAGPCDIAETCSGTSAACPPNSFVAAGTVCRAAAGVCDVQEVCSGTSAACPPDGFAAAGTVCRAAAGPCDVAETCSGSSAACPPDGFAAAGTVCRAAAGPCDVAEVCSGASATCPPDSFRPNTFQCRPGGTGPNAVCDPPENCTGSSAACPPNVLTAPGTACETGNLCTADTCNADGVCVQGPVTVQCPQPAICQDAVTCNPADGSCVIDFSDPGAQCENPDLCITGGTCNGAGVCTGGTPVDCSDLTDQCNVGTCNPDTGGCFAQPTPDVACENPDPCINGGTCSAQGTCTGGTPTDCSGFTDQCNVGTCNLSNGTCFAQPTPDVACENPDPCIDGGTCNGAGVCTGGTPRTCPQCQVCGSGGTCVPGPVGAACENPDLCINGGTCTAQGTCTGGTPVSCDQCLHCVGGQCVADPGQNGDACNDGLFCTSPDTCQNGVCTGPPTCPEVQCFTGCDESLNICTGGCNNDREQCCPGLNGHSSKCCPKEDICDNATSGAVNCRKTTAEPGTCGGRCRPEGDDCDDGLNCIGPKDGPVSLCAPSTSNQMCCVSTGFIAANIPAGGCPTNNDTCFTQPNVSGACGCFSAYKFPGDDWRIECCDAGTDAPDGPNCEFCAGGICPP